MPLKDLLFGILGPSRALKGLLFGNLEGGPDFFCSGLSARNAGAESGCTSLEADAGSAQLEPWSPASSRPERFP